MLTRMSGRLVVVLGVLVGLLASSQAAPITSISGAHGGPQNTAGTVASYINGLVTASDGTIPLPFGSPVSNWNMNLSTFTSNPGNVLLRNGANAPFLTIDTAGPGFAIFQVIDPITVLTDPPGTGLGQNPDLTAEYVLVHNSSAFNYDLLGQIWAFSYSTQGNVIFTPGGGGGSFVVNGTSSASWTMNATGRFTGFGDPIPEPASMALFGLIGLSGVIAARRKMRKNAV